MWKCTVPEKNVCIRGDVFTTKLCNKPIWSRCYHHFSDIPTIFCVLINVPLYCSNDKYAEYTIFHQCLSCIPHSEDTCHQYQWCIEEEQFQCMPTHTNTYKCLSAYQQLCPNKWITTNLITWKFHAVFPKDDTAVWSTSRHLAWPVKL